MELAIYILGLVSFIQCTSAYFVNIDAHAEECFFERVTAGTKLGKLILFKIVRNIYIMFNVPICLKIYFYHLSDV